MRRGPLWSASDEYLRRHPYEVFRTMDGDREGVPRTRRRRRVDVVSRAGPSILRVRWTQLRGIRLRSRAEPRGGAQPRRPRARGLRYRARSAGCDVLSPVAAAARAEHEPAGAGAERRPQIENME